ncbi:MAG: dihydrofolate reductase family protein [Lysobacter sp.]
MRTLTLQMQMSVDGRVAAERGGWQLWGFDWSGRWDWDAALKQRFNATLDRVDGLVLSRPMAEEGFIDHWTAASIGRADDADFDFTRKLVALDKTVISDKIEVARWPRTRIAGGGLKREVNALKAQPGRGLICYGGVGFAQALTAAGLIDEFEFYLNPAAAGTGESIFPEHGLALDLLDSQAYACGMVVNRYRPRERR